MFMGISLDAGDCFDGNSDRLKHWGNNIAISSLLP